MMNSSDNLSLLELVNKHAVIDSDGHALDAYEIACYLADSFISDSN